MNKLIANKEFVKLVDIKSFDIKKLIDDGLWFKLLCNCDKFETIKHVVDNCQKYDLVNYVTKDEQHMNCLYYACRSTNPAKSVTVEIVKYLVNIYCNYGYDFRQDNVTVDLICRLNDLPLLKQFISQTKIDLNVQDKEGNSLIHRLCKFYKAKIIQFVINLGVELNSPNHKGYTPIHMLCDRYMCVQEHIDNNPTLTGMIKSLYPDKVITKYTETLQYMIDKGAKIDVITNYEETPLHLSVLRSNLSFVKCLVENGANCNSTDCSNRTPIMSGTVNKVNNDVVQYLLPYSTFNIVDSNDWSLIRYICYYYDKDTILHAVNQEHFIMLEKDSEIIRHLIKSSKISKEDKKIISEKLKNKDIHNKSNCIIL